jgi:hypothetical protein
MLDSLFGPEAIDSKSLSYKEYTSKFTQAMPASYRAFKSLVRIIDYLKITLPVSH